MENIDNADGSIIYKEKNEIELSKWKEKNK